MFNIPEDIQSTIDAANQTEAIVLPIQVGYWTWLNPVRGSKTQDARTYGGWQCGADSYEAALAEQNAEAIHERIILTNEKNQDYEAYTSRVLHAAVIGRRERWIEEKSQSHLQVLAMLASYDKKTYTPWSINVLTVRGNAAKFLKNALADWNSKTTAARRKVANGLHSNFFFITIGTFGQTVLTKTVGKEAQRTITYPVSWYPDDISPEYLRSAFVGNDIAERMAATAAVCSDWLIAWKDSKGSGKQAQGGNESEPPEEPSSDIPF
jgi:hypothetical protein